MPAELPRFILNTEVWPVAAPLAVLGFVLGIAILRTGVLVGSTEVRGPRPESSTAAALERSEPACLTHAASFEKINKI